MENNQSVKFNELLNEIIMYSPDKILVLEGKNDKSFVEFCQFHYEKKFILFTVEEINSRNNKKLVIDIVKACQEMGYKEVIGLIDKDYDDFENNMCNSENVYYYKGNDLESMLFNNNFESIYKLIARENPIKKFDEAKEIIEKSIKPLSILRYINHSKNLGYSFKDFDGYKKLFDKKDMTYKDEKTAIRSIFSILKVNPEDEIVFCNEYKNFESNYIKLVKGHDLIGMFVFFINCNKIRINEERDYDKYIILKMLIMSYRKFMKIENNFIIDNIGNAFDDPC